MKIGLFVVFSLRAWRRGEQHQREPAGQRGDADAQREGQERVEPALATRFTWVEWKAGEAV